MKVFLKNNRLSMFWWIVLGITIALGIIVLNRSSLSIRTPLTQNQEWTAQKLGITHMVYDLGIADINEDNFLDIYTLNHSYRQSILINKRQGKFKERTQELNFTQSREFPDSDSYYQAPKMESPGLYIYWKKAKLIFQTIGLETIPNLKPQLLKVQLRVGQGKKLSINNSQGLKLEKEQQKNKNQKIYQLVASGNGKVSIHQARPSFFTTNLTFPQDFPLERVYIGSSKVHPSTQQIEFAPFKDRHGMVWADFNSDQMIDTFIIRGGGVGQGSTDKTQQNDELMFNHGRDFRDDALKAGIDKKGCPGRQVSTVDIDRDGLLDIYVGCGRRSNPRKSFPNQLYHQIEPGKFTDIAQNLGLDLPQQGPITWIDVDKDQDLDLLQATEDDLQLWTNESGQFRLKQSIKHQAKEIKQLSVADYNNDGYLDIFATSAQQNLLLKGDGNQFISTSPITLGLPEQSRSANWVDVDNDGLLDLHTLPDGLYRQVSPEQFQSTGEFRMVQPNSEGFTAWFDADNDGWRDLVAVITPGPNLYQRVKKTLFPKSDVFVEPLWDIWLFLNPGQPNHQWLEVQLRGQTGNSPALGATVEAIASTGVAYQQVGQADDSHRSQGHYRLYFGLGKTTVLNSLKVSWPDGQVQSIDHPDLNQLLSIKNKSR